MVADAFLSKPWLEVEDFTEVMEFLFPSSARLSRLLLLLALSVDVVLVEFSFDCSWAESSSSLANIWSGFPVSDLLVCVITELLYDGIFL